MSVDQEKPPLPPVEAHPEPPLEGRMFDQLKAVQGSMSRRKLGGLAIGAAVGLAATAYGANRLINGSSTEAQASGDESEIFVPQPILASLDKEAGSLKISDVAESWKSRFRYYKLPSGDELYAPKFREFTTDEEFQKEDNNFIEADPFGLPEGSSVELMFSERDNEVGFAEFPSSITHPEDPKKRLYLWGFLKDSDGNPIDPSGNPAIGKVYAASRLFFEPEEKIEE